MFYKMGVLKTFAKFMEKQLYRNLCLNKVAGKTLRYRCFPIKFAKYLRTPILRDTSELLLLRFKKVINQNAIKKFNITKYLNITNKPNKLTNR